MDSEVLVAYATKYGATKDVAEKIGRVLQAAGLNTDVLLAEDVADPGDYRAVVVGSAVYIGRWRRQAARFLQRHEAVLAGMPCWLFSSGPLGNGDPVMLTQGWTFPTSLQPIADRIQPRETMLFHGAVDFDKLNWLERRMLKTVGSPAGDFRDWEAVETWAAGIAAALTGAT